MIFAAPALDQERLAPVHPLASTKPRAAAAGRGHAVAASPRRGADV